MDYSYGDAPGIPVGDVTAFADLPHSKPFTNPIQVVLEPVGHEHGFAVRAFDQVLQRVQLAVVETNRMAICGVDRSVGQLTELSGEGGGIYRINFIVVKCQEHITLQRIVENVFAFTQTHNYTVSD